MFIYNYIRIFFFRKRHIPIVVVIGVVVYVVMEGVNPPLFFRPAGGVPAAVGILMKQAPLRHAT